jgi:HlyD family secretion protein
VAALALVVAVVFRLGSSDGEEPPPRTVAVTRGAVVASVSATGNVTADTELALDFAVGGRLVELAVKEGDRVVPGQLLARVDPREGRDEVSAAAADPASARASIARAQREVEAAQTVLSGARASAVQNEKDYDAGVEQARNAVSQARDRQERNQRTYRDDVQQAERDVDAAERAAQEAKRGNDLIDRVTGRRRNAESELRAARGALTDARNAQRSGRLADQQAVDDAETEVTNAVTGRLPGGWPTNRR